MDVWGCSATYSRDRMKSLSPEPRRSGAFFPFFSDMPLSLVGITGDKVRLENESKHTSRRLAEECRLSWTDSKVI